MNTLSRVAEFHYEAEQCVKNEPDLTDEAVNTLRIKLIKEETKELEDAIAANDHGAALDALTDLQYVLDGAYLSLGFAPFKSIAFEEVHRSNMAKRFPDGTFHKRDDGKVIKPPGWVEPDLRQYVENR
jgi:predicted HAD superfamily Cof-like phosphohydrolase